MGNVRSSCHIWQVQIFTHLYKSLLYILWHRLLPEVSGTQALSLWLGWDALTFSVPEPCRGRWASASTQTPTPLLPRSGMEVQTGNSRNKSCGSRWTQGDHLPSRVTGKIDFKINSIYCQLLPLWPVLPHGTGAWAPCRHGGAPREAGGSGVSTSRSRMHVCLCILKPPATVLGNLSRIIMFIQPPFSYNSPLSESQLCFLAWIAFLYYLPQLTLLTFIYPSTFSLFIGTGLFCNFNPNSFFFFSLKP